MGLHFHFKKRFEKASCCLCGEDNSDLLLRTQGFHIVQCKNCQMIYVNPRLSSTVLNDVYDNEYFKNTGEKYFDKSWRSSYFRPVINQLIDVTNLHRGKVLDVGTAAGHFVKFLKEHGFNAIGIEPSLTASSFARKHLRVEVKTGDLLSIMFKKKSFDLITMNDVIEHMPDPRKNLEKAYSLLKPGGWLMLTTPNIDSLGFNVFREGFVFLVPAVHLWYFSPKTLSQLLTETGFSVQKINFPYFDTPFFNVYELGRLGINLIRKCLLTPRKTIPSAPWYGNVVKIYAQKR